MSFSRIYNGVHTYNQVLNGLVWGFFIYYTFSHVVFYELCRFVNKVEKKSPSQLIWNPFIYANIFLYIVATSLFLYNSSWYPTPLEWISNIKKNCVTIEGLNYDPEA